MEKLLLVLVLVLAVIGIAQIAKVYQLASNLKGRREEDISNADNRLNAVLMLVFVAALFAFFIYLLIFYNKVLLPVSASEHGVMVDFLFDVNWIILFTVFFIVNFLLFFFSYKYAYNPNRKALFLAHNNTLELVWTVIPSLVLVFLIVYGLRTWNEIMEPASPEAVNIEIYGKQFDWTARYGGEDNKLGKSNFTLITGENPLGIITPETIENQISALTERIEGYQTSLENDILPDSEFASIEEKIQQLNRQRARVMSFQDTEDDYSSANDDVVVKGEFHIPVNKETNLIIRSRDVIHSVYIPHFRLQMNAVPGMTTLFKFTPTITTDSMRVLLDDPSFHYVMMCNKVCGTAHYNMQMNVVVESEEDYNAWLAKQKNFKSLDEEDEESIDDENSNETALKKAEVENNLL